MTWADDRAVASGRVKSRRPYNVKSFTILSNVHGTRVPAANVNDIPLAHAGAINRTRGQLDDGEGAHGKRDSPGLHVPHELHDAPVTRGEYEIDREAHADRVDAEARCNHERCPSREPVTSEEPAPPRCGVRGELERRGERANPPVGSGEDGPRRAGLSCDHRFEEMCALHARSLLRSLGHTRISRARQVEASQAR